MDAPWQQTACILCECNCGVEVRVGGTDGRRFERIRGDKAHPASQGYTCEKALRLDHYQQMPGRVTSPLRRRPDGTFEEIDWDTAIREVAARLANVRDTWGGETIFYYGGGGQGNHLGGSYSGAVRRALGSRYSSNALAQEKTGEFWVNARMFGTAMVRGEFEHAEVALFIGKNPYQSHSLPHARTTLKEIARDPERCMIVIDPRRSETAELADIHLAVRPGTDAFCLAAIVAVLVQERLVARSWLAEHATGLDEVERAFADVDVDDYAARCGLDPEQIRAVARRLARAASVAVFEDLGVQMNRHSTLVSYLEKLMWALVGSFAKPGGQYVPSALVSLARTDRPGRDGTTAVSPVAGARIIGGLVPCNVMAEEILTDHPKRYRAMIVESGNPAHSVADSVSMREALQSLDTLVVIDVAMTETARHAHYVLPAATQYEKYEATFFNFEFPHNVFHLRRPVLDPPAGVLPEPEIHARLLEALGVVDPEVVANLRAAAERSRADFAEAFFATTTADPALGELAPYLLYRGLGPTLPDGAAAAALLWGAAHRCALSNPDGVRRAGFTGEGLAAGEQLFDAIVSSPSGVVFTDDEHDVAWSRVGTADGRINLLVPELLGELAALPDDAPVTSDEFPLVLSAGERRSFTANTIMRDPTWRKRDPGGALRVHPADAARAGVADGTVARLVTHRGAATVTVEVHDAMHPGHVSLPNGMGLDQDDTGRTGTAPNDLTSAGDRDPIAGTPWHKHVPARLEAC